MGQLDRREPELWLQCPECQSTNTETALVSDHGRYCRCDSCGHVWYHDEVANGSAHARRGSEKAELLVWMEGDWRCEFWHTDAGGELRLYHAEERVRSATATGAKADLAMAWGWRAIVREAR